MRNKDKLRVLIVGAGGPGFGMLQTRLLAEGINSTHIIAPGKPDSTLTDKFSEDSLDAILMTENGSRGIDIKSILGPEPSTFRAYPTWIHEKYLPNLEEPKSKFIPFKKKKG